MSVSNQIQSLQFQLEIPSAVHNKHIQDKVVAMFNYGLQPMLDRLLSFFAIPDSDVGFECIELTLDPIALESLEDELMEKTETALKAYFETAFKQVYPATDVATPTSKNAVTITPLYSVTKTATVAYFLLYGHYPWWEKESHISFSQRWLAVLKEEQKTFVERLMVLGKKHHVLKRMAHQLNENALKDTVKAVASAGAEHIFVFHDHLRDQHHKKPIHTGISSTDFSRTLWEFTLVHLFIETGTAFNRKMFVKSHIKQIAQHYNMTYDMVLTFLHKGLEKLAENDVKKRTVFLILNELEAERIPDKKSVNTETSGEDIVRSLFRIVKKTTYSAQDKGDMERYIAYLKKDESSRKRFFKQLGSTEFKRFIAYMIPTEKTFIATYLSKIAYAHRNRAAIPVSQSDFMESIREMLLMYLFVETATVFNRKAFLKNQLSQIAKRYNMEMHEILQFLAYGLEEVQTSSRDTTTFSGILKVLLEEHKTNEAQTGDTVPYQYESLTTLLIALLSLRTLAVKEYDLLLSMLKKHWKNKHRELLKALPEAMVPKLLYHLAPQHYRYLQNYIDHISALHATVFAKASPGIFKDHVQYSLIVALLSGRQAPFNPKTFTEQQLKKIASHFSVEYIAVLFHLMEEVSQMRHSLLKDTLETLYLEYHVTPAVFEKVAAKTDFSVYMDQILYFLKSGSYASGSRQISKPVLEQVFVMLLSNYKEAFISGLKTYGILSEQNALLPGLSFFTPETVSVWNQFRTTTLDTGIDAKTQKSTPLITATKYKDILAFYLKTGALPWWADTVTLKEVITHLLEKPEVFYAYVNGKHWELYEVRRIYTLFDADEGRSLLHGVAGSRYAQIGEAINKRLYYISEYLDTVALQEALLTFALQNAKKSLPPGQFIKRYLEYICHDNEMVYERCILAFASYVEDAPQHDVGVFIKQENDGLQQQDPDQHYEALLQLLTADTTRAALKNLATFLEKQDEYTVVQLLTDLKASREETIATPVLRIFLGRLHGKNTKTTTFFTEVENLSGNPVVHNTFPGFYDRTVQFYIAYVKLKKSTAFHFDEFIMRWLAYMERNHKTNSKMLAQFLRKHPEKTTSWSDKFVLYVEDLSSFEADKVPTERIPVKKPPRIDDTVEKTEDTLTEKVLIFNSGLVLLWPFLTHCFKTLEYTGQNTFVNDKAQERAIYLLHYMATGFYEDIGEEQLVINKILCGFPVVQPLRSSMIPTAQENAIVESMLNAVIARWSKLGNTSIDGLRGSYIIREGYLEESENGYQLTIAKKGYDILLDYLPWKLELIKLPWMEKPLYVSWR